MLIAAGMPKMPMRPPDGTHNLERDQIQGTFTFIPSLSKKVTSLALDIFRIYFERIFFVALPDPLGDLSLVLPLVHFLVTCVTRIPGCKQQGCLGSR